MSADHDGDSRMSSGEESDLDVNTPAGQTIDPSTLSPPDSQHHAHGSAMPTSASGVSGANANGKRPLQTISNGLDDDDDPVLLSAMAAAGSDKERQQFPRKTHQPSGYTFSRVEDEPGFAWMNKKAMDEATRAWEGLVHKEHMIKNRYGDPFELAEREQAVLNSLKQR